MSDEVQVRDNPSEARYELLLDGKLAGTLAYGRLPDAMALIHTEVDPRVEGRGLGGALVSGALADIRARGLHVVPVCPFARSYIDRHPEYRDLLTAATQD